jgi:hypothetical protein
MEGRTRTDAEMSHTFTDENLLTWEAYASSGNFGLAVRPRIVFNCLSDTTLQQRYVERPGDEADAEEQVHEMSEQQLREMLRKSQPLE